jgi:hypothetical protein
VAFLRSRGRERVEKAHPAVALDTSRSCTGRPLRTWGDHTLIITLTIRDQCHSAQIVTRAVVDAVNTERFSSPEEPTCHSVMVEYNFAGDHAVKDMRDCGKALWKAIQPAIACVYSHEVHCSLLTNDSRLGVKDVGLLVQTHSDPGNGDVWYAEATGGDPPAADAASRVFLYIESRHRMLTHA